MEQRDADGQLRETVLRPLERSEHVDAATLDVSVVLGEMRHAIDDALQRRATHRVPLADPTCSI